MRNLIAITLLSVACASGSAYAQTAQPGAAAPAATTASPAASDAKMTLKNNWRASKLMGLDVYNENNEKLGDINEFLLDKSGKVTAVVIGVGGFLGMGEHDIAVSMDKLKFVEEAVKTTSNAPARNTTTGTSTAPGNTATSTTTTTTTAKTADANDWVPDHAVMSGTKDQLKAMKQFKYSDYN